MENKNIVMLKHSPCNIKHDNPTYKNQVDDDLNDYIVIDVTSRVERDKEFMKEHPTFSNDLSPFRIGPLTSSDGVVANIFEIFWQCGKVYPPHDDNGRPNADFFKWRNEFYSKNECSKDLMRHACNSLGYSHKDTKYFAYFDKDKNEYVPLDYIEARKKVYIPEYLKLVYNTESFKYLKSLVDSGKKIALLDFDAYNFYSESAMKKRYESYSRKCGNSGVEPKLTLSDFLNVKTMKDVVNFSEPAGHGFALKALLQGDIEIVDGRIIDKEGILE